MKTVMRQALTLQMQFLCELRVLLATKLTNLLTDSQNTSVIPQKCSSDGQIVLDPLKLELPGHVPEVRKLFQQYIM